MKKRILSIAFSFMAVAAIAQKKEIRNAEKAIKKQNFTEAKSYVNQAESSINSANESTQADFYYVKAMAYLGGENDHNLEDLRTASVALKKAITLEHDDAIEGLDVAKNKLVSSAIKDQNEEKYKDAAQKLIASYDLDSRDTVYLYYAAANYVSAKDYNSALQYFEQLLDLGFTGEEMEYLATNKETGAVETFSQAERDLVVRAGTHIKPEDRLSESKTGEIAKNVALIYIQNDDSDKAKAAINRAKQENPDDINLMLVEADMYNRLGDMKSYKEVMEEIVLKDPNNPTLFYNLGVSSAELGDNENAIKYYERALELDPSLINAQLNIASVILSEERAIVDEMNQLGTTKADNEKYDELGKKRKEVYVKALPYLEAAMEIDPNNVDVIRTIMNIYYQVDESAKAKEMQKKLEQIQG